MKYIILPAILMFSLHVYAQIKTERYFRVTLAKTVPETVLVTDSTLDGERTYFLSYSVQGRVQKKIVIDKAQHDELIAEFEKTLSEARQKRLGALIVSCGQPLEVKQRKAAEGEPTDRRLCLDGATKLEQQAVGKWWLNIRSILRL